MKMDRSTFLKSLLGLPLLAILKPDKVESKEIVAEVTKVGDISETKIYRDKADVTCLNPNETYHPALIKWKQYQEHDEFLTVKATFADIICDQRCRKDTIRILRKGCNCRSCEISREVGTYGTIQTITFISPYRYTPLTKECIDMVVTGDPRFYEEV